MKNHKSEDIRQIALANGWKAEVVTNMKSFDLTGDINDIAWNLYAMRNHETITVTWYGDRFESGLYVYGDYRHNHWYRGDVIKFLTGKPDITKFRKVENKSHEDVQDLRSVPWVNDTPAIDIMLAVINREIRWVRKIDGQICSAVVDVNLAEKGSAKHFRIYEAKSGRVLEWADALGFHTVALDQILEVS